MANQDRWRAEQGDEWRGDQDEAWREGRAGYPRTGRPSPRGDCRPDRGDGRDEREHARGAGLDPRAQDSAYGLGGAPRGGYAAARWGTRGAAGTSGRYYEDVDRPAGYGAEGARGYGGYSSGGRSGVFRAGRDEDIEAANAYQMGRDYEEEGGYYGSTHGGDYPRRSDYRGPGVRPTAYGHSGYGPAAYGDEDYRGGDQPRRYTPNPREGRGPEPRSWWDRTSDEVTSWFGDAGAERRREWDASLARHRGRGPKGYVRSDERIREDVNDRLTEDPYLDARGVEVTVAAGEVTLSGTAPDREAKRRAEDLADGVSGVKHVQNNLRIARSDASDTGDVVRTAAGEPISGHVADIADGDV